MAADTAKVHFTEDIGRARNIYKHAMTLQAGVVKDDLLRAAWMMAVGACDAYFCDTYVDLLAKAMRAKDIERAVPLPDAIERIEVPIGTVFHSRTNAGWEWRMFARNIMERENVLSIKKIRELLNPFFREKHKIISASRMSSWIVHKDAKFRLFGMNATTFRSSAKKDDLSKQALTHLQDHFSIIFQRRHDCIHNCDRPKSALQKISETQAKKTIEDVDFFINRCHEDINDEFPTWLATLGFDAVTRNSVGA